MLYMFSVVIVKLTNPENSGVPSALMKSQYYTSNYFNYES